MPVRQSKTHNIGGIAIGMFGFGAEGRIVLIAAGIGADIHPRQFLPVIQAGGGLHHLDQPAVQRR